MQIKNNLKNLKFIHSKKLGQNFLISDQICEEIYEGIDFSNVDLIIEVGCGTGMLTKYLLKKNIEFVGIELDKRLHELLKKKFKNANFINNDILKTDLDELSAKYKNILLISNLPYSITSEFLLLFMKSNKINTCYLMLQKESVERINSIPKTKKYNAFTVLSQTYLSNEIILNVDRENFNPQPHVDSVFVKFDKIKKYDERYYKFLKVCFSAKRRTLINNLKILNNEKINDYLHKNNLSNKRPEEIDKNQFMKMYEEQIII